MARSFLLFFLYAVVFCKRNQILGAGERNGILRYGFQDNAFDYVLLLSEMKKQKEPFGS